MAVTVFQPGESAKAERKLATLCPAANGVDKETHTASSMDVNPSFIPTVRKGYLTVIIT